MHLYARILARIDAALALPTHIDPPRDTLDSYRDRDAIRGLPDRTTITATHRPVVAESRRAA